MRQSTNDLNNAFSFSVGEHLGNEALNFGIGLILDAIPSGKTFSNVINVSAAVVTAGVGALTGSQEGNANMTLVDAHTDNVRLADLVNNLDFNVVIVENGRDVPHIIFRPSEGSQAQLQYFNNRPPRTNLTMEQVLADPIGVYNSLFNEFSNNGG